LLVPQHIELERILNEFCKEHSILLHGEAFAYLQEFESKIGQMSLF